MNILITAAATAHAYQVERLIDKGEGTIFLGDSAELPEFMLKNSKLIRIPAGSSPSFAHELLTICLDKEIVRVYPLRKDEVKPLSESMTLFAEYGIRVMVPSLDAIASLEMSGGNGVVRIDERTGILITDAKSSGNGVSIFTVD